MEDFERNFISHEPNAGEMFECVRKQMMEEVRRQARRIEMNPRK